MKYSTLVILLLFSINVIGQTPEPITKLEKGMDSTEVIMIANIDALKWLPKEKEEYKKLKALKENCILTLDSIVERINDSNKLVLDSQILIRFNFARETFYKWARQVIKEEYKNTKDASLENSIDMFMKLLDYPLQMDMEPVAVFFTKIKMQRTSILETYYHIMKINNVMHILDGKK
jgi:hypothetical protein